MALSVVLLFSIIILLFRVYKSAVCVRVICRDKEETLAFQRDPSGTAERWVVKDGQVCRAIIRDV